MSERRSKIWMMMRDAPDHRAFPIYVAIAPAQKSTWAVFDVNGVTEKCLVHVWAVRKARLHTDPEMDFEQIDYTEVIGLVLQDGCDLVAVDDPIYVGTFIEYIQE